MSVRPVQLDWQLVLPTRSLQAAWAVFSDTDRFNRAARLGFVFSEQLDEQGRRVHIGTVQRLGMTLTWTDDPFSFIAPRHFTSVRRFHNGPLARLETTMRLHEGADGVVLDYTIRLFARSAWVRPVVALDAWSSIRPSITKVLSAAASQLGDAPRRYSPPPPLAADALARIGRVRALPSGPDLERTLREADLREQDRLRPVALARQWKRADDEVLRDLLSAVEQGVLELRFDLICPRCQGPSQRRPVLAIRPGDLHCASCDIAYDGSFPDSVEVSFRPAPAVRDFVAPLDCANSPAHSPHRIARADLAAGGEVVWSLDLSPGAYRIDLGPGLGGASLEVREKLRDSRIAIDATEHGLSPAILRVGPGQVEIAVRSRLSVDSAVLLERRWRPDDALTAGQLLERPDARALLPDGTLPTHLSISARQAAVLVIDGREAPQVVAQAARRLTHGTRTARGRGAEDAPLATLLADGCWLAVYDSFERALTAARSLLPSPRLALLVDQGSVTLIDDKEGVLPQGATVDRAIAMARRLGVGRLAVPAQTAQNDAVKNAITRSGMPFRQVAEGEVVWLDTPPAPANPDAVVPASVGGRYALGDELARGGMGIVYAATDATTGEQVVVKVLSPQLASEPSYAQRFFWEARVSASLTHPHTITVFDYGADGPYIWLVMERLHGQDLSDCLVEHGRLPPERAVPIAIQALEGLAAAHAQGIVHRDVKPANLFLCAPSADPRTKVLDFGIAVSVHDDLADEGTSVLGTPRYLSPEQVDRGALDGRADVYALGTVLYETLTATVPFEAHGSRAMALIRTAVEPRPLRGVAPHLSEELEAVVMKALARDPEDRWPDARAMADALRKVRLP